MPDTETEFLMILAASYDHDAPTVADGCVRVAAVQADQLAGEITRNGYVNPA